VVEFLVRLVRVLRVPLRVVVVAFVVARFVPRDGVVFFGAVLDTAPEFVLDFFVFVRCVSLPAVD
jgi:hypothetical protein